MMLSIINFTLNYGHSATSSNRINLGMDVFTQRMTIVYDHLSANEPQQALNELNALVNKKKSLAKLTDKQKALLSLVKCSCLARLNNYGEALVLLRQFINEYGPWDKDAQQYSRMLVSVAIYLRKLQ